MPLKRWMPPQLNFAILDTHECKLSVSNFLEFCVFLNWNSYSIQSKLHFCCFISKASNTSWQRVEVVWPGHNTSHLWFYLITGEICPQGATKAPRWTKLFNPQLIFPMTNITLLSPENSNIIQAYTRTVSNYCLKYNTINF